MFFKLECFFSIFTVILFKYTLSNGDPKYPFGNLLDDQHQSEEFKTFNIYQKIYRNDLIGIEYNFFDECLQFECEKHNQCDALVSYKDECHLVNIRNGDIDILNQVIQNITKNHGKQFVSDLVKIAVRSNLLVINLREMSLGDNYFYSTNDFEMNECIQKCFINQLCFGVTFLNNECRFYKDLQYTKVSNPNSVSYVRSDSIGFQLKTYLSLNEANYYLKTNEKFLNNCWDRCLYDKKNNCKYVIGKPSENRDGTNLTCYFSFTNQNVLNSPQNSNYESLALFSRNTNRFIQKDIRITSEFKKISALSDLQCWIYCETTPNCMAASFNHKNFDSNKLSFSERYNCYLFNNTVVRSENDEFWATYIIFKGKIPSAVQVKAKFNNHHARIMLNNVKMMFVRLSIELYCLTQIIFNPALTLIYLDFERHENTKLKSDFVKTSQIVFNEKKPLLECLNLCKRNLKNCYAISYDEYKTEKNCIIFKSLPDSTDLEEVHDTTLINSVIFYKYSSFGEECVSQNCEKNKGLACHENRCECKVVGNYYSRSQQMCLPCRSKWTAYKDSCFKYHENAKKTWEEARADCKIQDSLLIQFKNENKFEDFKKIFAKNRVYDLINSNSVKAWIGAGKILPSEFTWSVKDYSPIDSSLWYKQPVFEDRNTLKEGCVGFDASAEGKLNDLDCNLKLPFFCEYKCRDNLIEAGKKFFKTKILDKTCCSMSENFTYYSIGENKENCWKFISDKLLTWSEAKTVCTNLKNSNLLVTNQKETFSHFLSLFKSETMRYFRESSKHIKSWVGSSTLEPLKFKWSDGSIIDPIFWANDAPDNGAENCVALSSNFEFKLVTRNCYVNQNFVCEHNATIQNVNSQRTCRDGWILNEDSCYKYFKESRTWYEAKEDCENLDSTLLTLKKGYWKINEIRRILKDTSSNQIEIWVGSARLRSKQITWLDNSKLSPKVWNGDNSNDSAKICAAFDASKNDNLNMLFCDLKLDYFCEYH